MAEENSKENAIRTGNRKRFQLAVGHDDVKTIVWAKARNGKDRPREEARVRTTRENLEDNSRAVSALSLSS